MTSGEYSSTTFVRITRLLANFAGMLPVVACAIPWVCTRKSSTGRSRSSSVQMLNDLVVLSVVCTKLSAVLLDKGCLMAVNP